DEEALADAAAEPAEQHLLERARRRRRVAPLVLEVERQQAVDEVVPLELVDVLLEREVDVAAAVADERPLLDRANLGARHPRAQPGLDLWVAEVEEVAGVVPHEAVLHDGPAVAARLRLRL